MNECYMIGPKTQTKRQSDRSPLRHTHRCDLGHVGQNNFVLERSIDDAVKLNVVRGKARVNVEHARAGSPPVGHLKRETEKSRERCVNEMKNKGRKIIWKPIIFYAC